MAIPAETAEGVTAGKVFSKADIAGELNVVPGLCYRYFSSKQELFRAAMDQYVRECCEGFIQILHDRSKPYQIRMDEMASLMSREETGARYHDFYHKAGNEALHEQLTIQMCKYMLPHVVEELTELCRQGKLVLERPALTAEFLVYGQIGLLQNRTESYEIILGQIRSCMDKVLGIPHKRL